MSPEFALVAIACGVGSAVGCFMAARRAASLTIDYALRIVDVPVHASELGEDEIMDGSQLTFADAAEAIEARNAVLDAVADRNTGWLALAAAEMAKLEPGQTGIGEDYRRILLERGVPPPKHPNAFGAFIATMARRGVLVPTGEYRAMREAKSNGRKSAVYRLQRPEAA